MPKKPRDNDRRFISVDATELAEVRGGLVDLVQKSIDKVKNPIGPMTDGFNS